MTALEPLLPLIVPALGFALIPVWYGLHWAARDAARRAGFSDQELRRLKLRRWRRIGLGPLWPLREGLPMTVRRRLIARDATLVAFCVLILAGALVAFASGLHR